MFTRDEEFVACRSPILAYASKRCFLFFYSHRTTNVERENTQRFLGSTDQNRAGAADPTGQGSDFTSDRTRPSLIPLAF